MKAINFEKQGIKFYFRNPCWDIRSEKLIFEYKVIGIKENDKNDGYYYNSSFLSSKNAMELNNVKINNKNIAGVGLPEDILIEVKNLYETKKEQAYQTKLNNDINYTLNDMTSYGIYNGISQFDIETIVQNIKQKYKSDIFMFSEDIAKILNKDEELKQIAINTYQPHPEGNNWREEYLTWYRLAVKEKEAPGIGIIPNKIIKEKITNIIINETNKINQIKKDEENKISKLFELAKQTGKPQLINHWIVDCNDPKEECSTDICYLWAMPNGTKKQERTHTW